MISNEIIRQLYLKHLGRLPESAEIFDYHRAIHANAQELEKAIVGSPEYTTRLTSKSPQAADGRNQSWRAYAQPETLLAATSIEQIRFQEYLVTNNSSAMPLLSMLMPDELALLYDLAANRWSAQGVIVDAGPLLGLSTYVFAKGISANKLFFPYNSPFKPIIYSFDLFRNEGDYTSYLQSLKRQCVTTNLLHEYLTLNAQFLHMVLPHQGDFVSWAWPSATPIEILFLDLAKSWTLNQHAISNFFPALIPGTSVLVQQDYVHFNEYWIAITMEHFADEFKCEGFVHGATAYFTLQKPIPARKIATDLASLPYSHKIRLLQASLEKAPPSVREVLKSSLAKCAFDHGDLKASRDYLELVDEDKHSDDPHADFSAIARSNKAQMLALLANHRQGV